MLDFPSSLEAAKEQHGSLDFELFVVSLWAIWYGKNKGVIGNPEREDIVSAGLLISNGH